MYICMKQHILILRRSGGLTCFRCAMGYSLCTTLELDAEMLPSKNCPIFLFASKLAHLILAPWVSHPY